MADPFDTGTVPTTEPESIVAGSYVAWQRELDLDSTLYSVAYRLTPTTGGTPLTVNGTTIDGGAVWTFVALSAVTGAWREGEYRWDIIVTRISDSEKALTETGVIRVFVSTADRRTHAEVMLAKIESLLSGRADDDIDNYTIKNRSISKMPVTDLIQWRDYYRAEIARTGGSSSAGGRPKNNTVRVRWI
jgi:hypothetical protein